MASFRKVKKAATGRSRGPYAAKKTGGKTIAVGLRKTHGVGKGRKK